MRILTCCFLFCRWHRKLLLRAGASHETASYPNDSQPAAELWTVQENGDICVCLKNYHIRRLLDWILTGVFIIFFPLFNISLLSVLHVRGHTRRQPRRWQSTTVTTTSSSCGPYGQTTCLSSASRCSAVSRAFGANEPSVPNYLWKISFLWQTLIILTALRQWRPWTTHGTFTAVLSKLWWC